MAEYIYQMVRARKAVGEKLILDDVTMAFLPGAKIGMVGPNGAGKSTILKIMAGLDHPSNGEAALAPGFGSALLLFTLGAAFSLYEGVHKIAEPHPIESPAVGLVILAVAAALEAFSFRTAIVESRPLKGSQSWWRSWAFPLAFASIAT